jgi:hypothetical protein
MHGRHHLAGLGRDCAERHHMHEHSRFVISICDAADHKSTAMAMVALAGTDRYQHVWPLPYASISTKKL